MFAGWHATGEPAVAFRVEQEYRQQERYDKNRGGERHGTTDEKASCGMSFFYIEKTTTYPEAGFKANHRRQDTSVRYRQ